MLIMPEFKDGLQQIESLLSTWDPQFVLTLIPDRENTSVWSLRVKPAICSVFFEFHWEWV
jgi:hypothetical protein